ncbi:Protein of unknown function (DUF1350) [Seminavis robusta]|uniref:Uncharacterized protein n=1 Tax=Seminavis robusta TaxID=568900 RepID=A0A9N8DPR8_9STRA|nr:Protein of unknown function (DUF1350) [Seminavis robusta]|eukprot:Sro202_g085490.1 Protein of unknown function (DUF1350) (586) ;mRNA; f:67672-69429
MMMMMMTPRQGRRPCLVAWVLYYVLGWSLPLVTGWCLLSAPNRPDSSNSRTTCSHRPSFLRPTTCHRGLSLTRLWERQKRQPRKLDDEDYAPSLYEDEAADSYLDDFYQDDDNDVDGYDGYEDDPNQYYQPPRVEWEELQVPPRNGRSSKVFVLLPPSPPTMHPLPSAILHFVGGTGFGSSPKDFYRQWLEDIVLHTQCAIVVTPLPVITPLDRAAAPLDHVDMARSLRHQFQYAFRHVLQDEYEEELLASVPVAGLGHSLGARILVVLATMMNNNNTKPSRRGGGEDSRRKLPELRYKSMILVSFTNFGASAGIPGIGSIAKERQRLNRKLQEQQQNDASRRRRSKINSYYRMMMTRMTTMINYDRNSPRRNRRRRRDNDYDDEDDIPEWGELWSDFTEVLQEGADRIKTQVTPQAHNLEFSPTPRQLWRRLGQDDNECHYHVPQTLLVQFDQDDMDQSAKLATLLMKSPKNKSSRPKTSSTTTNATTMVDETETETTDLKFARLRGTHLTPVTPPHTKSSSSDPTRREGLLKKWSSKSFSAVWGAVQGNIVGGNDNGGNLSQAEALLLLRQSITRYITDVVTK